jgi:hypothetical protein
MSWSGASPKRIGCAKAGAGGGERLVEGLSAEGPLSVREVVTAWARVSGRRRLVGCNGARWCWRSELWWLGAPGEVVSGDGTGGAAGGVGGGGEAEEPIVTAPVPNPDRRSRRAPW